MNDFRRIRDLWVDCASEECYFSVTGRVGSVSVKKTGGYGQTCSEHTTGDNV